MSVSTPRRRAPSESTYCTGSRASCGTVNGCTWTSPTASDCRPSTWTVRTPSMTLPFLTHRGRACRRSGRPATRCAAAKSNTPAAWSPCSCVTRMRADLAGREAQAREAALGVGQVAGRSRSAPACAPASATRQFPWLPLASEAKRSSLLQLLEAAARGCAARCSSVSARAVLVEDAAPRSLPPRPARCTRYCSALAFGRSMPEQSLSRKPSVLLAPSSLSGIGVAHEVEALLAVAVLDGEADAVEREADAAPGAVERLDQPRACSAPSPALHELARCGSGAAASRSALAPARPARRGAPSAGAGTRPRVRDRRARLPGGAAGALLCGRAVV